MSIRIIGRHGQTDPQQCLRSTLFLAYGVRLQEQPAHLISSTNFKGLAYRCLIKDMVGQGFLLVSHEDAGDYNCFPWLEYETT
jgi:hypothetical protein